MEKKDWTNPENAMERYNNPNNPYDTEYPFLRKEFEKSYENSLKFGVPYAEYEEGYLEGKYVIPSELESPFALSDKGLDDSKSVVLDSKLIYRDEDGNVERIYPAPAEANGLRSMGRIFFDSNYEGYQTLVNMFNKIYGDEFAQIYSNPFDDSYGVYVDPVGTGGDFSERYLTLENAIALNYHPSLTKVELLPFIHSEEDRESYMKNPSAEKLIEIFSSQLGINFDTTMKK